MQPLLPDAPRCLSAPVSWQMCNLGGEMSRTEISCLFLTSSLQTHQTQSTITMCVCVCVCSRVCVPLSECMFCCACMYLVWVSQKNIWVIFHSQLKRIQLIISTFFYVVTLFSWQLSKMNPQNLITMMHPDVLLSFFVPLTNGSN